jgi:hypothetical protein
LKKRQKEWKMEGVAVRERTLSGGGGLVLLVEVCLREVIIEK